MTWHWIAVCVGLFSLLNGLVQLVVPGAELNRWWIDLHWLPTTLQGLFGIVLGAGLIHLGRGAAHGRQGARAVVALAAVVCLHNGALYLWLRGGDGVASGLPLPLSWLFASLLLGCLWIDCPINFGAPSRWRAIVVLAGLLIVFPLLQMAAFGRTDYRRPADAIVVFGARAYADGQPSHALYDRVATACALYREGYAPCVLMSGGPGDGAVHETESMRRLARRLGVPEDAILTDIGGFSTRATAHRTDAMLRARGARRVLAVSHAFHLPRVKLAFSHVGRDVHTVPAKERYVLTSMPYLQAREIAAWWVYSLRGMAGE